MITYQNYENGVTQNWDPSLTQNGATHPESSKNSKCVPLSLETSQRIFLLNSNKNLLK